MGEIGMSTPRARKALARLDTAQKANMPPTAGEKVLAALKKRDLLAWFYLTANGYTVRIGLSDSTGDGVWLNPEWGYMVMPMNIYMKHDFDGMAEWVAKQLRRERVIQELRSS